MSVVVDPARCSGCSRCLMCCPVDAIRVWAGICQVLEPCIDCDLCARYCPADAITPAPAPTPQARGAGAVAV